MNAIDLQNVSVSGRIERVSLALPEGALVGLIGPNGSGKSTLLQAIAGLLPASGSIAWHERSMHEIPILERGRLAHWVPQEAHFAFGFPLRSVVAQARFAHGDDNAGVDEAISQFGLEPLAHRPVNQLSGGERMRVLLARALATGAKLQLWDEPLAPLDVRHALQVLVLARQLAAKGHTLLLSLHDLRAASHLDRLAVMHEGNLCAFGAPDEVLTPELLMQVFGVRVRVGPGPIVELP